jgi:RNA polymerase sigma-70 factor (ECF subfamily)
MLRLPDKYRIPVILSYLEGRTNAQVAEFLQWPVGTVKGRLFRARRMLRARFLRRGLALFPACLALALSHGQGSYRYHRVTPRLAVWVTPPPDAEIVTEVELLTLLLETVKVALVAPASARAASPRALQKA